MWQDVVCRGIFFQLLKAFLEYCLAHAHSLHLEKAGGLLRTLQCLLCWSPQMLHSSWGIMKAGLHHKLCYYWNVELVYVVY